MTDLHKRVSRRTLTPHRGRRIVVSLEPGDLLGLREERTRRTYYFPIAAAFDFAVKMHVAAERAARPTSREAKALAELLDVIEPALTLTPTPAAKPAPAKEPAPNPQPGRQQALDLN